MIVDDKNDLSQQQKNIDGRKSPVVLYTVKDVANILKTNVDYVYKLIRANLIPYLKLGQYKIREEALIDFLRKYEGFDLTDPFNVKKLNNDENKC